MGQSKPHTCDFKYWPPVDQVHTNQKPRLLPSCGCLTCLLVVLAQEATATNEQMKWQPKQNSAKHIDLRIDCFPSHRPSQCSAHQGHEVYFRPSAGLPRPPPNHKQKARTQGTLQGLQRNLKGTTSLTVTTRKVNLSKRSWLFAFGVTIVVFEHVLEKSSCIR